MRLGGIFGGILRLNLRVGVDTSISYEALYVASLSTKFPSKSVQRSAEIPDFKGI
jgi:hypothetical protein